MHDSPFERSYVMNDQVYKEHATKLSYRLRSGLRFTICPIEFKIQTTKLSDHCVRCKIKAIEPFCTYSQKDCLVGRWSSRQVMGGRLFEIRS